MTEKRISFTNGGSIGRRDFMASSVAVLALLGAGALAGGCSEESSSVLRVGVLPDQSKESLRRRYKPLFDYIAKEAGIRYELVIPDSYGHLVALFEAGEIEIAYFGGFTFVKTQKTASARPLVMRDVDREFKSVFLVPTDSAAASIHDLEGRSFSFGSRLSTSGHLMPRHFLTEQGINPEAFFSRVTYSGAHDKTAHSVQNGETDCGVLNGEIAGRMFENGALDPRRVKILWQTPPYADYVWTIRGDVDKKAHIRIRGAFLSLRYDQPAHRKILEMIGAKAFLPARADNFSGVRRVAESLKLL